MKYKILLFLCLLILTASLVCAATNTSTDQEDKNNNHVYDKHIKSSEAVKTSSATRANIENQEAECYYGGRINYNLESTTGDVDEGRVELYVNNTSVASKNEDGDYTFEWMYDTGNKLDNYPSGQYPIKIKYTYNGNTIESNTATLNIIPGQASIYPGEITTRDGKIILPVEVISSYTEKPITHGTITATSEGQTITSINYTINNQVLTIPAKYQQKNIQLKYSDNGLFFEDRSEEVFLDILVPGSGQEETQVTLNNMQLVNKTSIIDNEAVTTALDIYVAVEVTSKTETIKTGSLTAYHNGKIIANSNNATGILIPAKYNTEEITLNYTGTGDYNNSTVTFTLMVDKIRTKTYTSRIQTSKNTPTNIYPSITSNYPFLYGKLNVYLDNNLVKTINAEDSFISIKNARTTITDTLDLSGFDDGEYNITVEVEENNLYTQSEYTTSLTIAKIGTYIYAYNKTIYVGDTSNLYARVYANNRAEINTGLMSFYIDGQLTGTEEVKNNTASIEYATPSTLSLGQHTLKITYNDKDNYNTSNKEITLTLARTSTTTTLRTWNTLDEKIVLNTQTRAWNKTINNGNIEVYINNNKTATQTVTENTANITLPTSITTDTPYHLRIVYTGTDQLNASTYENTHFIFNKKNTTTRVYPYLANNGTLTLTGYVYSDNYAKVDHGTIIFTLDNKEIGRANVNNNKASTTCTIVDYDAGNYTLKATYTGSLLYKTSSNNTIVTKNPYYHKTYMTIHNRTLTVKRGGSTDINATLTSYTRNITENINAQITLNATWGSTVYTQDVTFTNGKLNTRISIPSDFTLFTFNGQEITTYTLTINTQRSKNFMETSQTGTIQIGEKTRLYQKAIYAYKQNNITLNTTLQNNRGNQVNTNTTAKIDIYTTSGNPVTSISSQIINGKLNTVYKLPANMTEDKYILNITAKSNNDYAGSYKTVNITLNNRRTYITATNIKAYIGNNIILNGSITDSITRTRTNTNAQVDIHIDGKKITTINTNKGTYRYVLNNNYTAGIHTITYTYKGDSIYANTTRTFNFTSNKNTIRISMPTINAKIGDTINIKATITHTNGSTIKDALKANIQLNGKTIANNVDINSGQLTYAYNIPTGSPSNNKITVTIQETSKYNTRSAGTTLKISKDYQFINLAKTTITTTKGSKITITGNVTDKNKNPINNARINIKIAGTDTGTITSSNGKFSHEHTITQNTGTYDILITALESNNYLSNAKHMSLKIT